MTVGVSFHIKALLVGLLVTVVVMTLAVFFSIHPYVLFVMIGLGCSYVIGAVLVGVLKL